MRKGRTRCRLDGLGRLWLFWIMRCQRSGGTNQVLDIDSLTGFECWVAVGGQIIVLT